MVWASLAAAETVGTVLSVPWSRSPGGAVGPGPGGPAAAGPAVARSSPLAPEFPVNPPSSGAPSGPPAARPVKTYR
jgi:hypothetical protein